MSSLVETNHHSDVLEYPAHHLKVGTTDDWKATDFGSCAWCQHSSFSPSI